MRRRTFLGAAGSALMGSAFGTLTRAKGRQRPNILWITCEDISPHLGCYGDEEARTPHLDGLARQGVLYRCAFSVSGVCAPSRSCLITGMHPTTLGTHHMRCNQPPRLPVRCFSEYLRDAGYYCTNNVKTDYNFPPPPSAWDECSDQAHWRNRPDREQPFFAVFNLVITHESRIGSLPDAAPAPGDASRRYSLSEAERALLPVERHDPARAQLPPYYPDTPLIRRHWAHYYDLITAMDSEAGRILGELDEDGLADNTAVFFFSDHGAGLPRMKRWMYDCGIRVPLVIRWPRHVEAATQNSQLVSFVDFAPTVLSIAGVPIPDHLQGRAFLGPQAGPPREFVFAARDRMDERYDIIRAVRDNRFKYIRNLQPQLPYAQHLDYPESFPVMRELRRVCAEGGLNRMQSLFFQERKPPEELYDLDADPHEVHNLAGERGYEEVLKRLRGALDAWMAETGDLALVPETQLAGWLESEGRFEAAALPGYPAHGAGDGQVYGKTAQEWTALLKDGNRANRLEAINAVGILLPETLPVVLESLKDPDAIVVFWAAMALGNKKLAKRRVFKPLVRVTEHPAPDVRLAAARALYRLDPAPQWIELLVQGSAHPDAFVRLRAVQFLEEVAPNTPAVCDALRQALDDSNQYVVRVAQHALAMANP